MTDLNILEQKTIHNARCIPFPEYFPCEDESVYSIEGIYHHKWRKMMVYCNMDITGLNILHIYQVIPFETLFGYDFVEKCASYRVFIDVPQPESIDTLAEQTLVCRVIGGIHRLDISSNEFHEVEFEINGALLATCLKNNLIKGE